MKPPFLLCAWISAVLWYVRSGKPASHLHLLVCRLPNECYLIRQGIISEVIHTDRAQVFFSQQVRTICTQRNIRNSYTSGSHSRGNGMAERSIQTIMSLIRCQLTDMQEDGYKVHGGVICNQNLSKCNYRY